VVGVHIVRTDLIPVDAKLAKRVLEETGCNAITGAYDKCLSLHKLVWKL
jgi:hypothetical protein